MEGRKISFGLRGLVVAGAVSLTAAGTGAYIAVEAGSGSDKREPDVSVHLTPTPTDTPLVYESPLRTLEATETPTPGPTLALTEAPVIIEETAQNFTKPPRATYRPTWTPTPFVPTPTIPVITFAPTPEPWPTPEARYRDDVADQLFGLINNFRIENGEFALNRNQYLDATAKAYSKDYYERGDYINISHSLGGEPVDRANSVDPNHQWLWVGDVMTVGSNRAEDVMTWWLNSPPHKAALLSFPSGDGYDMRITEIGVKCYEGPNVRQSAPNVTVAVCVGSMGIPDVPTP